MSALANVFFDGNGPLGLTTDFLLNATTEAGGAIVTAIFTAGLLQVANEWRRDIQRDNKRSTLRTRLSQDLEVITALSAVLAEYAPLEVNALGRGELTVLPPTPEAPAASNSVQVMAFLCQATNRFQQDLIEIAPLIRIRKNNPFKILTPFVYRDILQVKLQHSAQQLLHQVKSFISEVNDLERERVKRIRLISRAPFKVMSAEPSENEGSPEYYKNDLADSRMYSLELVSAVWRHNKIYDSLTQLNASLAEQHPLDNFMEGRDFREIVIDGRAPRQSFVIEVRGEHYDDIYRR